MKAQRNTRQRQLILDIVRTRSDHPSAEEIYKAVRALDPKISRGTVYRNLNLLTQNGEVLQVQLPKADRFEGDHLDLHYHLLCTGCGAVSDVPAPYQSALDREIAEKTGYAIDQHHTVFEGLCPDCRAKTQEK